MTQTNVSQRHFQYTETTAELLDQAIYGLPARATICLFSFISYPAIMPHAPLDLWINHVLQDMKTRALSDVGSYDTHRKQKEDARLAKRIPKLGHV